MKEKKYGMVNPERANDYICYLKENKEVVAYASMKKMADGRIFFGIGLKPGNCGKGMGIYFLKDSLFKIKHRYPESIIYLEVRSWNKRAINSYKKVGFILKNTVTKKDRLDNDSKFVEMELSN
ncbi:MAG: GNAT family N-acetyltransferase [Bacilli bacterium]